MRGAEVREPLVVDAHRLNGGVGLVHPPRGAQNAVEHLALHAVQVLVLDPQLGIRQTANALPAVLVDTLLRHPVRAMDAPRDVLSASRAHAPRQPEARALL